MACKGGGWVDGSEQVEEATDGFVKFADLSEGLPTQHQHSWDWEIYISTVGSL